MNKLTPLTPTISAIKLESNADDPMPRIYNDPARLRYLFDDISGSCGGPVFEETPLPPGKWHILGPVSELTPEQKAEIVEITDNPFWIRQGKPYIDYTCNTNCFSSIDDAFQSLLQSKRVYTVNPWGDKPIEPVTYTGNNFVEYAMAYSGEVEKWNEAQQYVGNWILIEKEV